MQLVDTHCHIHEALDSVHLSTETRARYKKAGMPKPDDIIARAIDDEVIKMICVGTTLADSQLAVRFVRSRPNCWVSIGIHPHEAKDHLDKNALRTFADLCSERDENGVLSGHPSPTVLTSFRSAGVPQGQSPLVRGKMGRQDPHPKKIVAIGECGLDYYYTHSPKKDQETILRFQIELALKHDLPMIFHVRDAFNDFWKIFDEYKGIRGVIHSFSAGQKELEQILSRNLYVGLNGIMTFTKNQEQLNAAKAVPTDRLLLETDAPFLTPYPYRGTICEPKHIRVTASFLAQLRDESLAEIAKTTTKNACELFGF